MTEQQIVLMLATKVMGWKRYEETDFWYGDNGNLFNSSLWNPLQNISDAWMLVEKIGSPDELVSVTKLHEDGSTVYLCNVRTERSILRWPRIDFTEEGETAQEAICKAAMKVVA